MAGAVRKGGTRQPPGDDAMKAAIAIELYQAARSLGAKSDLLGIIGSFGDTLDDDEVLRQLRRWNAQRPGREEIRGP